MMMMVYLFIYVYVYVYIWGVIAEVMTRVNPLSWCGEVSLGGILSIIALLGARPVVYLGSGLLRWRACVVNRYSRIPVAQLQQYEYGSLTGEPCT